MVANILVALGGSGMVIYAAVLAFETAHGQEVIVEGESTWGGFPGEPVAILYDPLEPETATINTFYQVWVGPVAIGLVGLILAWEGTTYWIRHSRPSPRNPDGTAKRSRRDRRRHTTTHTRQPS